MSKDLLLEIGTEEVPAHAMPGILDELAENAAKALSALRLEYKDISTVGTPAFPSVSRTSKVSVEVRRFRRLLTRTGIRRKRRRVSRADRKSIRLRLSGRTAMFTRWCMKRARLRSLFCRKS